MELRLTFKKKEIADLFQESYDAWNKEWTTYFASKNLPKIILISITILTFALTFVHFDWIYYAFGLLLITFIYDFRIRRQKRTNNKEVKKWKEEVDSFLRKYDSIDDIKYIYDNDKIQYFEQSKLIVEIRSNNIVSMDTNDKWLYVYMKDSTQNIWIPRVIADQEELTLFEQTIERKLKTRTNKSHKAGEI